MASTGRKAAARRTGGVRKETGKSSKDGSAASAKTSERPISKELQAQMDATRELNPAAGRGRNS